METLSTKGRNVATHVKIVPTKENGLKETSHEKCEQILTISKDRLLRRWGTVGAEELAQVGTALKTALEMD